MNPLFYFIKTPSRYRRDAALICSALLTIALAPLFFAYNLIEHPLARGAEGATISLTPVQQQPGTAVTAAATTGPAIVWPAKGPVSLEYGAPDYPYMAVHTGIDIAGPNGQPIGSMQAGTVTQTGALTSGCGQCVFIDHGNGVESRYSHLSRIAVVPGQHVEAGTTIGYEGSTGWSTGPHLHLAIYINGAGVNPRSYIPGSPAQ